MQLASSGPALPASRGSFRALALLAAAVLAVHLLLLQGTALVLEHGEAPINRPFITRTIPPAVQPERPKPAPKKPAVRRVKPPAPPPAPPVEAAPPAAPTEPAPAPVVSPASAEAAAAASAAEAPASDASAPQTPPPPVEAPRTSAVSVPGSMRIKYKINGEVSKFKYSVSGELLWLHDGKTYDARMEISAFILGSRIQTSSGVITPEGLAPTRYAEKVRSEVAAHFERAKGKVIFSANTGDADLQPGAQDQLSIFMQIASLIGGDPARYPKGTAIEMQAVGARYSDTWRVVVDEEETLHLPAGDVPALKLVRPAPKPGEINVELWVAPSLGYLPVRIRLTQDNGDFIDQQMTSSETP